MLRHNLERRMYTLELIKKTNPSAEDLAIRIDPRGRRHIKLFATIHTFPEIPTTFFPIVQMVIRSGAIDGSVYGEYGLIPHGRGKTFGQLKPEEVQVAHGMRPQL